jgi:hypothetical protein
MKTLEGISLYIIVPKSLREPVKNLHFFFFFEIT